MRHRTLLLAAILFAPPLDFARSAEAPWFEPSAAQQLQATDEASAAYRLARVSDLFASDADAIDLDGKSPSGASDLISEAGCDRCQARRRKTCGCVRESAIYARIEYFHWNERIDGNNFVNEDGPLFNLGYYRRVDRQRLRGEFFGSQVTYTGQTTGRPDGDVPLSSHTNYIGGRVEYDYFLLPDRFERFEVLTGLGVRMWDRDLVSAYNSEGEWVQGYREFWLALYPYLGAETRRDPNRRIEWYGRGRLGLTAFTHDMMHGPGVHSTVYPRPGLTGLFEGGLRGQRAFVGAYVEFFAWDPSGKNNGMSQPRSSQLTAGVQTGITF